MRRQGERRAKSDATCGWCQCCHRLALRGVAAAPKHPQLGGGPEMRCAVIIAAGHIEQVLILELVEQ